MRFGEMRDCLAADYSLSDLQVVSVLTFFLNRTYVNFSLNVHNLGHVSALFRPRSILKNQRGRGAQTSGSAHCPAALPTGQHSAAIPGSQVHSLPGIARRAHASILRLRCSFGSPEERRGGLRAVPEPAPGCQGQEPLVLRGYTQLGHSSGSRD